MKPDNSRELIPHDTVLHLIGVLDTMKTKLLDAAQQWQLLDENGRVPASPSYTDLLQHAVDAQALSHNVVQLTADFARTPHSTNRVGRAVLARLAMASTMSSHAVPCFAETAETALALSRAATPIIKQYPAKSMVIEHATARAYLRRASESLRDASKELDGHLDFHRFFPARQLPPARSGPASHGSDRGR